MVEEKKEEAALQVRLWGIPIDRAIAIVQTVGVPTLFMIFVCYLIWSQLPPIASAHIKLLEKTGNTLEQMDNTLKDYNVTIQEFSELGKETSAFMKNANEAHTKALEAHIKAQQDLDEIKSTVVPKGIQ